MKASAYNAFRGGGARSFLSIPGLNSGGPLGLPRRVLASRLPMSGGILMGQRLRCVTILVLAVGVANTATRGEVGPEKRPRPLILAHYMPWFESKATSGTWGWHWTMGH